jgi:hypothetical protein
MKEYGAYLTTEKLIGIELPERHHDSGRHNREVRKCKADLLARNLRFYIDSGPQKPKERWVLEKAIEVLKKQTK